MIRLFIALELSERQRHEIVNLQNELKQWVNNVRWVKIEGLHLTLKFIGETEENNIESIKKAIDRVSLSHEPFEVDFSGLGVFPSLSKAKVLWLAVNKGKDMLINLAENLDSELTEEGFKPEKRGYQPHLTLGRIRQPIEESIINNLMKSNEVTRIAPTEICDVTLFESNLTRQGPLYKVVYKKRLDQ